MSGDEYGPSVPPQPERRHEPDCPRGMGQLKPCRCDTLRFRMAWRRPTPGDIEEARERKRRYCGHPRPEGGHTCNEPPGHDGLHMDGHYADEAWFWGDDVTDGRHDDNRSDQ